MSDEIKTATLDFFKAPNTIPAVADKLGISREVVARRVRALETDGKLKRVGKENRDGQGRKGQRPVLYQAA